MEGPEFLKRKYDLHNAGEVKSASLRTEKRTGEKAPRQEGQNQEEANIQNYLDRLEELALDPEHKQERKNMGDRENTVRSHALFILRDRIMNRYVRPNKNKLAEGARVVEERAARQLGIDMHYEEDQLLERGEIAVKDLESSLDQWISYLSDLNEPYPTWFRYYVFRNILDIGEYDKDKKEFPKRTAGTNRLFPDVDRGALARIQDIIECSKDPHKLERFRNAQKVTETPEDQLLTIEKAKAFASLSFAKQYAESIQEAGEITPEMRAETNGKWVKYAEGTDPTALWASLQNKGTAWCTKGFATAESQLQGGDFYVYYTLDKKGEPKIPRIAIRMQNGSIFEARGVADSAQNLEGNMTEIADKKMSELPGKEKYQRTSADMKKMTTIYEKSFKEDRKTGEKTYLNPSLSKDDLIFIYEINAPIEGFGYDRDPRIDELRLGRNLQEDMPIVFECDLKQIARNPYGIKADTKAYIGPLFPGIFRKLPNNLEHIYTSFPENKIRRENVEIGGKSGKQLLTELETAGINLSLDVKDMLRSQDFEAGKNIEEATLIRLTVADLGFNDYANTDQVYKRAEELGLELCPSDVAPHYRLKYKDQPMSEWLRVGMEQIADSDGIPSVFSLGRHGDGLWLGARNARSNDDWAPFSRFVFRLRKVAA